MAASDPTRVQDSPPDPGASPTIGFLDSDPSPSLASAPTLAGNPSTPAPGAGTLVQADSPGAFLPAKVAGVPVAPPGYEIVSELGRGGMGVVYLARDLNLNRFAAIKMIVIANADAKTQSRFLTEAEVIGMIRHPGIVQVYGFGYCENQPYFVLEYLEGGSLAQQLARGPRPTPRESAEYVRQLADAMAGAHAKGVVHRDLKPGNVLVSSDGALKITDFGIAKLGNSELTVTGAIMGTPNYMSPEQAAGDSCDVGTASDIYSLGVILYELLAGRPPFVAETTMGTLRMVVESEPDPVRNFAPGVPRDLETICMHCLRKSPAGRYATAAALAADLRAFLDGEPIAARPTTRAERFMRRCARRPALTASIALLVFVLAVGGPALWSYREWALATEQARASDRERLEQEEKARKAAEDLAATEEYYASLNRLHRRVAAPRPGWTWTAVEELEDAAQYRGAARDAVELRTLLATVENALDLRKTANLGTVVRTSGAKLAASPDGKWLAVGDARVGTSRLACRVRLIQTDDPSKVRELQFPNGALLNINKPDGTRKLAFSPDGRWLVAGTRSGLVHRWDMLAPDAPPAAWRGNDTEVAALAFDSESRYAYMAHFNGEVVRHAIEGKEKDAKRFRQPSLGQPLGLAYLPDYRPGTDRVDGVRTTRSPVLVLAGADGNAMLDVESLQPIPKPFQRPDHITAAVEPLGTLAYDAASRSLYSARGPAVKLFETRTFTVSAIPVAWPNDSIESRYLLAMNAVGSLVATTTDKGRLVVAESDGGAVVSATLGDNLYDLAFHPTRPILYLAADEGILAFEVRRPRHRSTAARTAEPISRFALTSVDKASRVATIATAMIRPKWPILARWDRGANRTADYFLEGANAGHDGYHVVECARTDRAIVCCGWTKLFRVERAVPSVVELARSETEITALALRDDGEAFWTAEGAAVHLRSTRDGRSLDRWANLLHVSSGRGSVRDIAAGPTGLAVACRDGRIVLLRNDSNDVIREWVVERDSPTVVDQANGGATIVVGTESGTIHVGSSADGPMTAQRGHEGRVVAIAAANGGEWIATASIDGETILWKLSDGLLVRVVQLSPPGTKPVRQLHFSDKGDQLYVLKDESLDVQVWDLAEFGKRSRSLGLE